ncbi:GNAT family N-acetyltransferase [Promethearchaeum syntrophicum]|uniref:GNAT family N-acetyltransferase n=1 Tax=Promethearchaeum syntrophicum TaxID=2594042 RepID=A0A5B9DAC4_9ARCH|nr:GNAT family N-acetyltransferase [Candidatus Prometheoarchaeum syntrophicum]QEE16032.1 hypothetical protein DSAG12_01860 [Candidatus Prometheoarchaeum syntrophicum]
MNKKDIRINGERIYLVPLTVEYASEKYCSWLNDPVVNKYLDTKNATIENLQKYIKSKYEDPNCLFFGIFDKKTNKHIGNVKLEPIDFNLKTAVLGTLIGEKNYWGMGIAPEVYKYLLKYAFDELKLETITAGMYKGIVGALKAVKKVGFKIHKEFDDAYKVLLKKEDFIF